MPDLALEAERYGIEDPRITRVGDEWLILYTGYSSSGPLVCLAATHDFRRYERRGVILPPEDKDAALFPDRIGERFALIHRPVTATRRHAPTSGSRGAPTSSTGRRRASSSRRVTGRRGKLARSGSARRRFEPARGGSSRTTA